MKAAGMKVLMTADAVGGVWTYALELIRALPRAEFALAVMGPPMSAEQRLEARALGVALYESAYRLEWMDDSWDDVRAAGGWLLDIAAAFRPDIVHLNGYAHGVLPWNAPVVMVGHSCVNSWWEAVKGEPAGWDRYSEAVRAGLQAADVVVAPSRAMLAALERHYGVRGGMAIPNGRSLAIPPEPKQELVFAAGRLWDEAKNIRALTAVARSLPWPVYVAGDSSGPRPPASVAFEGVHLLGRLGPRELARWYARAAIYALPARYEPFGLTVLEAALAGCALVLGDIPSLRENWDGAAVFVNDASLGAALGGLIRDAPRRTALQEAARERARRFSPAAMAAGYEQAYAAAEALCAS